MSTNNKLPNNQDKFICFMCGVCCQEFRVVINIDEGRNMAKKIGLDWKTFKNKYLEKYYIAKDRFLIRQIDDKCIFLKQVNHRQALCQINEFKPSSCFEWQANNSKPECKLGLRQIWNLDISPDGEITGIEADIRNFDLFVNSLI